MIITAKDVFEEQLRWISWYANKPIGPTKDQISILLTLIHKLINKKQSIHKMGVDSYILLNNLISIHGYVDIFHLFVSHDKENWVPRFCID